MEEWMEVGYGMEVWDGENCTRMAVEFGFDVTKWKRTLPVILELWRWRDTESWKNETSEEEMPFRNPRSGSELWAVTTVAVGFSKSKTGFWWVCSWYKALVYGMDYWTGCSGSSHFHSINGWWLDCCHVPVFDIKHLHNVHHCFHCIWMFVIAFDWFPLHLDSCSVHCMMIQAGTFAFKVFRVCQVVLSPLDVIWCDIWWLWVAQWIKTAFGSRITKQSYTWR